MTQPDELPPDRIWVGNENKDLRFRHDAETEKYLGPATEYIRAAPRIDDQVDVEELARAILKDQVGLSIDADTATITMQPDSFYRCIRAAHYNLTRKWE